MNGFKPEEIVLVQGKPYPTVGGRLRLLHERNDKVSIKTEVVHFELGVEAVVKAEVITAKGTFTATGVATAARDARLIDALLELAETRGLSRSLRFAGYGFELGYEELGEHQTLPVPISPSCHKKDQPDQNSERTGNRPGRDHQGGQPRGGSPASSAQLRCIRSIARTKGQDPEDIVSRLIPGADLDGLTLAEASRVIAQIKANGHSQGGGR